MENNWIEIKRFLNDYKKIIIWGAILFSLLFALAMFVIDLREGEEVQNEDEFELSPSEILNDAQPAYFQVYIEYEDGTPYTNYAIISQYFNLDSVKEEASEISGVDIESIEEEIEEEILLNDIEEEIKVINVSRNDNHLYTISFNTGNERDNLAISEYYFDLIFEGDIEFFSNKLTYLFVEPSIATRTDDELAENELELEDSAQNRNLIFTNILGVVINAVVGFILGIALMIGLALLKVIFEKKLNYSFAYDIEEDTKFMLFDSQLNNAKNVSQFVVTPFEKSKLIVSEQKINPELQNILSKNEQVSFEQSVNPEIFLLSENSLADVEVGTPISEIIILIHPSHTTRAWYKVQKEFSNLYDVPTKIIQVNN